MPSDSDRGVEIVEPTTVEAAAGALADARERGRRVSIGRRAAPPDGCDVLLSTAGLDRLLEHEAGDLTCVVEPGLRLSQLAAALAERGQMLAIDPPGDPTLGACLAADLSGPLRHRYGSMRDLVLGVTVVLADGTVASAGGKVVKNVAGYDLGKLFCGSRGTLGLVARMALRLHPLPEASASVATPARDARAVDADAGAVLRSVLLPSALDCLWDGSSGVVCMRFEGTGSAVEAQVAAVRELIGAEPTGEDVWERSRATQAAAAGRVGFAPWRFGADAPAAAAVARVAAGVAYTSAQAHVPAPPEALARLHARIRAEFDPDRVLLG